MSASELLLWITNFMTIAMGVFFLRSKQYMHLRAIPAYAFSIVVLSLLYRFFFSTSWHFYLVYNIIVVTLYLLAYCEASRDAFGKAPRWTLFALVAILLIPYLPIRIDYLSVVVYFPANILIALSMTRALGSRHPVLILMTLFSAWAVTNDVGKLFYFADKSSSPLYFFDVVIGRLFVLSMIGIAVWQPVTHWLYHKLHRLIYGANLTAVPVGITAAPMQSLPEELRNIVPFPLNPPAIPASRSRALIEEMKQDMDQLEPILKSAAQMVAISRKPFLNREELAIYLDIDANAAEQFIEAQKINRIYLIEGSDYWVVRRLDVDFLVEEQPR